MRSILPVTFQVKDSGAHLFTKIRIFNKQYLALIDTGATGSAFDLNFIREKAPKGQLQLLSDTVGGIGTSTMPMYVSEFRFGLGPLKFHQAVTLIDFSHVHEMYTMFGLEPFHFIIGNDILMQHRAIINYQKKTLSLEHPKAVKR